MKLLINYSNNLYKKSQKLNSTTGKTVGLFDEIISYLPKDIDKQFHEKNKKILNQKRGNGYWLWKPYFIKKSLERLNFGDFLFYCDAGAYFINPITPLIEAALAYKQDIICFSLEHLEKKWTKRDAFILINCDIPKYTDSKHICASYSLWKKTNFTINFINELLDYSQDERLITDIENQCGYDNYPEFMSHRHDQSIFSLLTKKHNLTAFRDPSQFGNNYKQFYHNSNYNQIIEHTRKKNIIPRAINKAQKILTNFSL